MQLSDWQSIQDNDFALPAKHDLDVLTGILIAQIGIPDADIREITYDILSEWILRGRYSSTALIAMIDTLTQNLQIDIAQEQGDGVFLRSYSALLLGEIVNYDNEAAVLDGKDVKAIFTALLHYLGDERDTRALVEGKGWAHAV